jgi:hypothetical protein
LRPQRPQAESHRYFFPMRPGDVVLIKGSRGVHLERAIEVLRSRLVKKQES